MTKKPKQTGYTDEQIDFVLEYAKKDLTWKDIAEQFNAKFDPLSPKTANAVRKLHKRYEGVELSETAMLDNIRTAHSAKKAKSKILKENKTILDHLDLRDELLLEVEKVFKSCKVKKYKVPKPKKPSKVKTDLAMELLLSDLHFGIKTKSTNLEVLEKRMDKIIDVVLGEYSRLEKNYNITKLVVLLNGDLIQGNHLRSTAHTSCELTDAEQIVETIRILFHNVILRISLALGIPVEIKGIAGNHDRTTPDRPIVDPGRTYISYVIYRAMQMLCEHAGLTNVSWEIAEEEFLAYEMFGHWFIVEHGHAPGIKKDSASLERQLLKRGNQVKKIIKGIRIGHYHEPTILGFGRHIINGSIVTDDDFATHLGYITYPCQTLSYYVDTKSRDTSYYHSLFINVEDA